MQSINEGIFGIDVSRWQGNIDWNRVKSAGVNVAIIKASGADDGFYEDSRFQTNYQGAVASGIKVGAYHFFTEYEDAIAQAEYFSSLLMGKTWHIKPAIDVESGLGTEGLTDKVIAFCERVQALTGLGCVVYCNTNYARNAFDGRVAKYPLWVAHYGVDTPGDNQIWQQWAGFQYSSDECIDGITENTVDKNRFTEAIFLDGAVGLAVTQGGTASVSVQRGASPVAGGQDGATYIVQGGDTLSAIAERFGTSWRALAEINGISNPDLIQIGQVLRILNASAINQGATSSVSAQGGTTSAAAQSGTSQTSGGQCDATYIVQGGDTLSAIAERFGTSWQVLAEINGISNPDLIYEGQVLRIV